MPAYTAALERDIALAAQWWQEAGGPPIETVFFGGGTPSWLPIPLMRGLIKALQRGFRLAGDCEITLEANPEDVDAERAAAWRAMGFNRLSIGAQAATHTLLRWLGRRHGWRAVERAVARARAQGFDNLNLDLIYGLPGLSLEAWRATLRAALELEPDHLSLYPLAVEQGTPLARQVQGGQAAAPDPDHAADQYELACELLAEHGFQHYELSNWARNGETMQDHTGLPRHGCRHNLAIWRNETYFGLGVGAHGYLAGRRYARVAGLEAYRQAIWEAKASHGPLAAAAWTEIVSPQRSMEESLLLGLRLLQLGVSEAEFAARHGVSLRTALGSRLESLAAGGWVELRDGALRLRRKAWLVANRVLVELLEGLQVPDAGALQPQAGRSK